MPNLSFSIEEFHQRHARTRAAMADYELDLLLVSDVANQHYLTGYDGWSFYTPQIVALPMDGEPWWIGRAMDTVGGRLTAMMPDDHVVGYPENFVQRQDIHPMEWIADFLGAQGFDSKRIGYESDAHYFSPRALACLKAGLVNAEFIDADLLVNWVRGVKSPAEISYMREAGQLVSLVMARAMEVVRPGVRQCDAIAEVYKTQMSGHDQLAGDLTGLCPLIMAGEAAAAPHVMWSERPFEVGQTCALEMGGAIRHYNAALARTLHLGTPPEKLISTAQAVEEGLEAVLETIKAGVTAHDVEAAWRAVIARYGLSKESRIGYGIGIGYPPDWGERTISLRQGEATVLVADNTVHVMLGMWLDGWGLEMSETVLVTANGAECLTEFPRGINIVS